MNFKKHARTLAVALLDAILLAISVFASYFLLSSLISFDACRFVNFYVVNLFVIFAVYSIFRIYSVIYSSIGLQECVRIGIATAIIAIIMALVSEFVTDTGWRFSIICGLLYALSSVFMRMSKRILLHISNNLKKSGKTPIMIIGAGSAGTMILRELTTSSHTTMNAVCFIDDDDAKIGGFINGIPIVGNSDYIPTAVEKYNIEHIIVALPSATPAERKQIYEKCRDVSCKVQTLPGIYQLLNDEISISKLRDVDIADLLGRDQIVVELDSILGYIENETVLVTGGGGSIGSELCRQIASHRPKKLIIFDIYENNAYDIEQELRRSHPELSLDVLIGSIRDKGKIETLFDTYRPSIVFNAAAHKHVPLMETSPNEAVKNNVFGTLNVARAADKYKAKRFVQISTDKAVNPTNIMGATKRICEMIIQTLAKHSETEFVAVRFGNVLGSNGSVIPLFRRQIMEGGPVTVTHKDIIRYFMTIQEAVSLVLQAGAYAKGGEIFVLDMGEPVKIYDLAYNLIKLSGLEPGVDIEIVCTGLRPGEKLYEERLMEEEGLEKTENELISIGKPLDIDEEFLWSKLDELYREAYNETGNMKTLVSELVPTYTVDKR